MPLPRNSSEIPIITKKRWQSRISKINYLAVIRAGNPIPAGIKTCYQAILSRYWVYPENWLFPGFSADTRKEMSIIRQQ